MRFCLKGQCNFCHEKVIILIKIPYVEDGNIFLKYLQFEEKSFVGRQNIMLCQEKIHVWKWESPCCSPQFILMSRENSSLSENILVLALRVQCIIGEIGVTGRFTVAPPTGKDTKWPTKTWKYFNVFSLKTCFSFKTFFSKLS